jgi:hypothetical protein
MQYEVRRRRGSFVEPLPGRPMFDTMDGARAWAQANADMFPVGVTAIEIAHIAGRGEWSHNA